VLVLDPDAARLSLLVARLTSQGMQVMAALTGEEARSGARRLKPRVIVSSSPLGVVDAGDLLNASDDSPRPVMIAFSTDDARLDWTEWDRWFPRSADPSDVVQAVTQALAVR
jgi:DNA-binding response OmpR family regulator